MVSIRPISPKTETPCCSVSPQVSNIVKPQLERFKDLYKNRVLSCKEFLEVRNVFLCTAFLCTAFLCTVFLCTVYIRMIAHTVHSVSAHTVLSDFNNKCRYLCSVHAGGEGRVCTGLQSEGKAAPLYQVWYQGAGFICFSYHSLGGEKR